MTKKITLGLIQAKCDIDPKKNLAKTITKINEAANAGAQIISTSEFFLSRYFCQGQNKSFFKLAETIPGPTTKILSNTAKNNKIVLVASIYEKSSQKLFNTTVVFNTDGSIAGKYRKIHIPDDKENGYNEAFYFSKGDLGYPAIKTKHAIISPMICFDQWFPESARQSALKGAQILLFPTAIGWPTKDRPSLNRAEHEAWQIMHRSHAIANNVFVAAINRVGLEKDLKFWGTSMVCDPYGRVITQASTNKEEILLSVCDMAIIDEKKKDWPFLEASKV